MDGFPGNVVWQALTGPHAHLALGTGAARLYPRDVAPFAAIATPDDTAYRDLAAALPPGLEARLFRPAQEPTPAGWETSSAQEILCMAAARPVAAVAWPDGMYPTTLGPADVPDMLALAEAARPGPFGPRTIELGGYLGVRDAATGALLAMGGTRFRLLGFTEISAIAVAPAARKRGLGGALTAALALQVAESGATPFLHVFPANPARALYGRLGFQVIATPWVIWRRPLP